MLYKIAVACMIAAIGAAPVPEVNPAALQNAATAIQQNPTLVNSAAAELQKNADMQAAVAKAAESLHQANTKAPEPTKAPESVAEPADAPQTAAQLAQKFQKPASMDIHLYGKLRKIVEDAIDYEFKVRKLTTPSADTMERAHIKVVHNAILEELKMHGYEYKPYAPSEGSELSAQGVMDAPATLFSSLKKIIGDSIDYEYKIRSMPTPTAAELNAEHQRVIMDALAFELKFRGFRHTK